MVSKSTPVVPSTSSSSSRVGVPKRDPSSSSSSRVFVPKRDPSSSSSSCFVVPKRDPSSSSSAHVTVPISRPSYSFSPRVAVPLKRSSSSYSSRVAVPLRRSSSSYSSRVGDPLRRHSSSYSSRVGVPLSRHSYSSSPRVGVPLSRSSYSSSPRVAVPPSYSSSSRVVLPIGCLSSLLSSRMFVSHSMMTAQDIAGTNEVERKNKKPRSDPVADTIWITDRDFTGTNEEERKKKKACADLVADTILITDRDFAGTNEERKKKTDRSDPVADTIWITDRDFAGTNEEERKNKKARADPVADTIWMTDRDFAGTNEEQRKNKKACADPVADTVWIRDREFERTNDEEMKNKKACVEPVADTIWITDSDYREPRSCCDICMDTKHAFEMIKISEGCSHSFCASCITMHVETKIVENNANVKCPGLGCDSVIEVDICRGFIQRKLQESWERLKCEAAFAEPQKYYCPFKDCSGMLIMDAEAGDSVSLRQCECPYCRRLFCANCRVPWHWKYTCEQFQSMEANNGGNSDVLLKELVQKKRWQRCPSCGFYVEKTFGCRLIVCRCRFTFCYGCGGDWRAGYHDRCNRL